MTERVGVTFRSGHTADTCDHPHQSTWLVAAYDQWGQRVATAHTFVCGDQPLPDPGALAAAERAEWPGRTICVWSDLATVPPGRLADASPDGIAGGAR